MGVLLMTDLSKLSETELLAIWNKDNFGLKDQLLSFYINVLNWQNVKSTTYIKSN